MGLDPEHFRWVEAPEKDAEKIAWSALKFLGAVDHGPLRGWQLTSFGTLAAELQIEPTWAKVLHEGHKLGMLTAAADLVGVLSVQSIFSRKVAEDERKTLNDAQSNFLGADGDLVMSYQVYCRWLAIQKESDRKEAFNFCKDHYFRPKALEMARATSRDLVQQCCELLTVNKEQPGLSSHEISVRDLLRLVMSGGFMNIGVRCCSNGSNGTAASSQYHLIDVHGQDKATVVAAIHPGSALVRGDAKAPRFVCYSHIMETSRTFLSGRVKEDRLVA